MQCTYCGGSHKRSECPWPLAKQTKPLIIVPYNDNSGAAKDALKNLNLAAFAQLGKKS